MSTDLSSFWAVLLWSFWTFIWVTAVVVWFHCLVDLLGDPATSGWGKAGWTVVLVLLPWLGALIYIGSRGRDSSERQAAATAAEARAL